MRIVLFTGKGGVGKTTLAAATAAHLARFGRKTLVVSTDPAHSLGDALEADLGAEPTEIAGFDGLFAAHVDARGLLEGSWGRLREHLGTLLAGAGVDELLADELTVLPGVEELLALGEVRRAARGGPWDVVVVDCLGFGLSDKPDQRYGLRTYADGAEAVVAHLGLDHLGVQLLEGGDGRGFHVERPP